MLVVCLLVISDLVVVVVDDVDADGEADAGPRGWLLYVFG